MSEYSLTHWMLADLDLTRDYLKWRHAVYMADHTEAQAGTFEWYEAARRYFLGVGGCYLAGPRQ